MTSTIIYHHLPSSTIIYHHLPSSTLIYHHLPNMAFIMTLSAMSPTVTCITFITYHTSWPFCNMAQHGATWRNRWKRGVLFSFFRCWVELEQPCIPTRAEEIELRIELVGSQTELLYTELLGVGRKVGKGMKIGTVRVRLQIVNCCGKTRIWLTGAQVVLDLFPPSPFPRDVLRQASSHWGWSCWHQLTMSPYLR